jgi:hypothetical protein
MKRGTPRHPKTDHLMGLLRLERWAAVGVLESLWHFTAGYAPRGDVGRFSDAEIAAGIDWRGDPTQLTQALVQARWLDRCRCHRLRVHDWPEHADQTVQRREEVKRYGLLACYSEPSAGGELAVNASDQLAFTPSSVLAVNASQPWPLPLPLPAPGPLPSPEPAPAPPPPPSQAAWERVLAHVAKQVPAETFSTWFKPTWIAWDANVPADELRVFVPNNTFRTWITRNYRQVLDKAMKQAGVGKLRLTLVLPEVPPPLPEKRPP